MKKSIAVLAGSFALSANALSGDANIVYAPNGYAGVNINVDGVDQVVYIASDKSVSSGKQLILPYNSRAVLMTVPSMDPGKYFKPNLLGGSIDYDVDLSTRNCGCIGTIYLVRAPGKDSSGNLWNTDGYYYCDAN